MTHSATPRVPLICSYHILTSSAIWHNSNESEKQKQERLNVRALRCVYNRWVPLHGDNHGLTLSSRCLQDIAILVFKAVNGMLPGYISDTYLFAVRNNVKCLRGPDTAEIRFFCRHSNWSVVITISLSSFDPALDRSTKVAVFLVV